MTDTSTTAGDSQPIDLSAVVARASGKTDPISRMTDAFTRGQAAMDAKDKDPTIAADRAAVSKAAGDSTKIAKEAYAGIEPIGDRLKPWDREKALKETTTSPLEAFGSFGSIFAAVASAFTHTPAINAMNGMAAAINAVKANDQDAYKKSYEAWKENMQLALDRHKAQHEDYEDAMKLADHDIEATQAKLLADSAKYGDEFTRAHLEMGDLASISSAMNARDSSARGWATLKPELEAFGEHMDTLFASQKELLPTYLQTPQGQQFLAQNPKFDPKNPDMRMLPKDFVGAAALLTQQKESEAKRIGGKPQLFTEPAHKGPGGADIPSRAIQMVDGKYYTLDGLSVTPSNLTKMGSASGDGTPSTPEERAANGAQASTGQPLNQIIAGYGKDAVAARKQAHSDAIKKIMTDTGMSAEDAGVEMANRTIAFQSGKKSEGQLTSMLGATRQATAQLDFNIGKTKEEMAKLPSSDISPVINAIARGEEKWTGDPAYSGLFFYLSGTAAESARLLSGGQASAAQLHQGAQEEATQWANINMTPASFDEVATAMHDEGENRIKTYTDAIKSQSIGGGRPTGVPTNAKQAPDGNWYTDDPDRPGKHLKWP